MDMRQGGHQVAQNSDDISLAGLEFLHGVTLNEFATHDFGRRIADLESWAFRHSPRW